MANRELSALHRFIIRNSDLFCASELAGFLGVSEAKVLGWQEKLGLPQSLLMDRERAFPIVLRRNHDLLAEEDIARLLGMSVDSCRKIAQEMDFLDIKLGPKPEKLAAMGESASFDEAADNFRLCCGAYLCDYSKWERPFSFLDQFYEPEPIWDAEQEPKTYSDVPIRIMYSYTGSHGDFLLTGEDFYPEGILSRLRNRGVNAGCMPALLRDLARSRQFPEFGKGHEVRIRNLARQVEKAAAYGIKIFLYLNEPRFMPADFFVRHPDARGMPAPQPGHYGMCTSNEQVRDWILEAALFIFRSVPGLGGVILITASENQTNCYSHYVGPPRDGLGITNSGVPMCPRCAERGPAQVLSDTARLIQEAVDQTGSKAQVIQWLWGWDFIMPQDTIREAIESLPSNVILMVDWAKNTEFSLFGRRASVGEYTLAYVKPSGYALNLISAARKTGRRVFSKCALVTTVEMNALPYLPVLENVETLLLEHKKHKLDGIFGCWIFGSYPGRNMEMLVHLRQKRPAESLARKYYGIGAEHAIAAWSTFSRAMSCYPTIVPVLYLSAVNPGPGLRFSLEPEPWRHGMVAMASERIAEISDPLGPEVVIKGFRKVAELFGHGLESLRQAIERSDKLEWHEENLKDYGICEACMRHFRSAANHAEFILIRDAWLQNTDNQELRGKLIRILSDELNNSERILDLAKRDSRIGYEGSIGYFYTPIEIIEKIYDLRVAIDMLEGKGYD